MADTGIGAGLPAVDASATAARKGTRADKQDASGDKASFGSAMERARDGNERAAADARQAENTRSGDAADGKASGKHAANQGDDEDGTVTRRNRPTIDIRMIGRIGAQAADGAVQSETPESLAAGTATIAVAKLPKGIRPAGQGGSGANETDSVDDDTAAIRPREAADEKTIRARKGQKAGHGETAGAEKTDAKAVSAKIAAGGSAESDALTLLQGADAAPVDDKAAAADKAMQAAKTDVPIVALAAHAMPAKGENAAGKTKDSEEHLGPGKTASAAHAGESAEGSEADTKTDAASTSGRAFRFSRADGRGQTLDMVIGGGQKDGERDLKKTPTEAVTVVDSRRYLALSQNSNTIMSAFSGDPEWTSAMQPSSALSNAATLASTGKVVNTLKIQIHPMTLGTVTATMRLAGDELTVDLAVETMAAYRQLSDDQKGLVESLRAQGFAVDQVSVTLVSPTDKTDSASTQTNGQNNPSFGQQAAQDGSASPRRDDRHASQQNWRGGETAADDGQTSAGAGAGLGGARPGTLYI